MGIFLRSLFVVVIAVLFCFAIFEGEYVAAMFFEPWIRFYGGLADKTFIPLIYYTFVSYIIRM